VNAESALIHPWRSCSYALPSLGAHRPVTRIDCMEIPTDFAHRDGLIGSIGQAICETVQFIPDVPVFRVRRPAADSAAHEKGVLHWKTPRIYSKTLSVFWRRSTILHLVLDQPVLDQPVVHQPVVHL
jgi:hypothetical protein